MESRTHNKAHRKSTTPTQALGMFPELDLPEQWPIDQRWPKGVECPQCGSLDVQHRTKQELQPFRCNACGTGFPLNLPRKGQETMAAMTRALYSRTQFLNKLRSPGKMPYRRYLASPLRYAGGKSLGVGYVIERLPDGLSRLVSPFMGGGSVEIACANELGMEVIAYDVFDILCTYWSVQLTDPYELAKRMQAFTPDRETFLTVKHRLGEHWRAEKPLTDQRDLAAHYYFNHNTSYGPHFLGWPSDIYLNEARYQSMVDKAATFSAPTLSVECAGFEDSMPQHHNDFFYCDPPYYLEDGKTFIGMYPHRNFPVHHNGFRHDLLRDYLLAHKGGFILSYNDCPTIREWYAGCEMDTPQWQYTFGQGDTRIGENRREQNGGSHIKKSHELLIWRHPA